jgi:putative protease
MRNTERYYPSTNLPSSVTLTGRLLFMPMNVAPGPTASISMASASTAATAGGGASGGVVPRPELLAPAGDWDCARAAVENGADAIYFGLERFNARMRAHNFTEADLPALMDFLHRRGVRGYVTFNTLVFQNEWAEAEHYVRALLRAGVDAAIVQDVGIARLIRRLSPDFPIHASTQMTITSAAGVAFARELGCQLVVLARECSLRELESIRRLDAQAAGAVGPGGPMPLEVFVHGALCVAYSGQCLTSEALGGRSANRGECAQACRMPYELVSDGNPVPLGDRRYLLSPQDLAGLEVIPQLLQAGVSSLKIEGRLKTPEYVANITRIYRQAIDRAAGDRAPAHPTGADHYEMEMAFSRGLHSGWFNGINNQELVHGRFGKKRGVFLGLVTRVQADQVCVDLVGPLKPGDGVVFDAGHPEQPEEGGRVYQVVPAGKPRRHTREDAEVWLRFGQGDVDFSKIEAGHRLWKTSDPELERRVRQTFTGEQPKFQRPLHWVIRGRVSQPLELEARDEQGHVTTVRSAMLLAPATQQPLTEERLRSQLGRLGGTPFKLGTLRSLLSGELILPVSELNRLRRKVVAELEQQRARPRAWTLTATHDSPLGDALPRGVSAEVGARASTPELIVLVRDLPQLEAALKCGVRTVYCEFDNPKRYREAVQQVRQADGCAAPAPTIWVAPPRIFKTGEEWTLQQVRACEADGYLVRNYDHLQAFAGARCVGDFSLNVANALSAEYFKTRFGLERLTASYDLNGVQLEALLRAAPPEWFEVTIHQHMPMFHMEHCVFCAFLSHGTDYTNCGRPCDKHQVRLRDRAGAEHPLRADVGCRNTVYNAAAQTGAEWVERLVALGARFLRVEFVQETPEQVERILAQYRQLLRGETTGTQLWRELKLINQLGVTRGTLESVGGTR